MGLFRALKTLCFYLGGARDPEEGTDWAKGTQSAVDLAVLPSAVPGSPHLCDRQTEHLVRMGRGQSWRKGLSAVPCPS